MRRKRTAGGSPVRALVGGVALLVALQWYGPGGYAHMKSGQHKSREIPAERAAPEAEKPPPIKMFGPYEMYGPFQERGKPEGDGGREEMTGEL
jgi:hypothetical protein